MVDGPQGSEGKSPPSPGSAQHRCRSLPPPRELPVSIRQMIEIAKALVHDAKVIIMDEPTSALNSVEVDRLFAIIHDLKSRGCGIIYISHRMEEIYANR